MFLHSEMIRIQEGADPKRKQVKKVLDCCIGSSVEVGFDGFVLGIEHIQNCVPGFIFVVFNALAVP